MVKRALIGVVVLGALGVGVGRVLRGGGTHDELATFTVDKAKFVRRVHAEGNLRPVKATPILVPESEGDFGALKVAWLAPDGTAVKKGDVLVRFDPSAPEKQLRDGEADRASANAKLGEEQIKSKAAIADRKTDAELANDELAEQRKFQSKDRTIFSRNQIIESEVDEQLDTAKQQHAEKAQQIEGRLSKSNTAVIAVERQKADLSISHAKTALASMQVVAPHDGIFVLNRNWRGETPKLGDSLEPGEDVGELPLLDEMEAEVFVLEVDGSGLADKQPAEVVVEARPDHVYQGKIRLVDKLAKPRQPGSPVQYFAVVIALAETDRAVMKPGQRVRATLVLDQEDALAVPRQAVIDREGKNIVYRQTASGFEPVTVELGTATAGRVVIKSGLAAGDVIALRDPTHAADAAGSAAGSASSPPPAKAGP
ncbi:MAG TPA: HlyD family efflux transporter periplasmic adaptor subunit [Kofleriaceae bacterium]|nr:HlyD family efflux transporter periplasmic adaptor subunit [Kofleriaceae bacterium]